MAAAAAADDDDNDDDDGCCSGATPETRALAFPLALERPTERGVFDDAAN